MALIFKTREVSTAAQESSEAKPGVVEKRVMNAVGPNANVSNNIQKWAFRPN